MDLPPTDVLLGNEKELFGDIWSSSVVDPSTVDLAGIACSKASDSLSSGVIFCHLVTFIWLRHLGHKTPSFIQSY